MLKTHLEKLEQLIRQTIDQPRVYFVDEDTVTGCMTIPDLHFSGTCDEGRMLMQKYPGCVFIVDDIPRNKDVTTC